MKTKQMTLSSSSGQRTVTAPAWMARRNDFLSELLENRISNFSVVCVLAFAICAVACIVLASDFCKLYGWAAFFALLCLNLVLPLVRELRDEQQ